MEETATTEGGSTATIPSTSTSTCTSSSSSSSSSQQHQPRRRLLQQQQQQQHHQCWNSRCYLDRQRRHAREDWFNQWSHMWTKRQTPEWRPRRASVATCQQQQHHHQHDQQHDQLQQQQQQQQQHYHCKSFLAQQYYELAHHLSLNASPDSKQQHFLSQQHRQSLAAERLATYCAQIKVNSDDDRDHDSGANDEDDGDGDGNDDDGASAGAGAGGYGDDYGDDGRNQQLDELTREKKCDDDTKQVSKDLDQRRANEREYESIVGPIEAKTTTTTTTTTTNTTTNVSPRSDECLASDKRLSETSDASTRLVCKPENGNHSLNSCSGSTGSGAGVGVGSGGSCCGCGGCDNNHCMSRRARDFSQVQRYHSASTTEVISDKTGRAVSESNRPSLGLSFCSNKQTDTATATRVHPTTCCSRSSSSSLPTTTTTTATTVAAAATPAVQENTSTEVRRRRTTAAAVAATSTPSTTTAATTTTPPTTTTSLVRPTFCGPTSSGTNEEALNVAVSEKLQLQDKQRKYLILSMALKQIIADRDINNITATTKTTTTSTNTGGHQEDFQHCSCRSRSCSFGFTAGSPPSRVVSNIATVVGSPTSSSSSTLVEQNLNKSPKTGREQKTDKESKMVLSSSRSMLIDKLNVERAAALSVSSMAAAAANNNSLPGNQRKTGHLEMIPSQAKFPKSDPAIDAGTGKRLTPSHIENNRKTAKHQSTTTITIGQNIPATTTTTARRSSASAAQSFVQEAEQKLDMMRQLIISQDARNNSESVDLEDVNVNNWTVSNQNSPAYSCELGQDTEDDDDEDDADADCQLEGEGKDARDTWRLFDCASSTSSSSVAAQQPQNSFVDKTSKRSLSVHSKTRSASTRQHDNQHNPLNSSASSPSSTSKLCDLNLEALIIESWLDDHPEFTRDYFMRKANHQLIDDWLVSNAKIINKNLSSRLDLGGSMEAVAGGGCGGGGGLRMSRPNSQQSLSCGPSRGAMRRVPDSILNNDETSSSSSLSRNAGPDGPHMFAFGRSGRSNSQSSAFAGRGGSVTPVRKISATDFESRTGSGFLRPMLSTTPDGRLTFLSQPSPPPAPPPPPPTTCDYITGQSANARHQQSDQSEREASVGSHIDERMASKSINQEPLGAERVVSNHDKQTVVDQPPKSDACHAASTGNVHHRIDGDNENNVLNDDTNDDDELPPADGEVRLIFELVKNICNDLDIRTLLHKILKNIAVLINADKSSLFLVCGQPNDPNRHLVSQLFNVDQDSREATESADSITIPWGTGLVGYVAQSGESVNIANCYEDPRFTSAIDQRTGYVTKHMLCAPIFDNRNDIVGVAQVINKRDGNPFTRSDEIKFKRYLQFCGIGLRNAQSYEHCQLENRRNQVLLDLARMIFEEQSTIEQVVYRIMLHTQSLLECERCQVLLIDDGSDDLDQLLKLPYSASVWKQQRDDDDTCSSSQAGDSRPPEWKPQCQYPSGDRETQQDDNGECKCEAAISSSSGCLLDAEGDDLADGVMRMGNHMIKRHSSPSTKLFSLVFDLECDGNDPVMHSNKDGGENQTQQKLSSSSSSSSTASNANNSSLKTRRFPINIGITSYVAMTGETLNIEDAHRHERFDVSVDEGSDFKHKSILCMPIRNGQRQIIGVSQLINKKNGRPFNKNDEDLFEAFAIFCGLGIHNTLMYERVLKIMAKQKVTFEVLSYHATAPLEEAKLLSIQQIPSCFALNLASLKFNDFSLDDQYMLKSCLRFFLDLDLMRRFQIDQLVFCNWILSVQKNYRKVTYHPIVGGNGLKASPVRYHNWRHAFNVSQMMFAILMNTQICQALGELETLALLIACLCHDLDHRGTNNSFQIKSASPLAELYSTSTMEHHHFDQCVMILNSQGNQILANLSPSEYSKVIMLLEEAILATDLANYFQKRDLFFQLVNSNQFDWQGNSQHRSMLRCMLMTACDVAAITKPWPVQKVVADLVISEFYQQGDIEKNELNIQPIDMMNRDKMSELPEMQISFIDTICAPIYTAFAKLFPRELSPLLDGCLANKNIWTEMANNDTKPDIPIGNYLNEDINFNETPPIQPTNNISESDSSVHHLIKDNDLANQKGREKEAPASD